MRNSLLPLWGLALGLHLLIAPSVHAAEPPQQLPGAGASTEHHSPKSGCGDVGGGEAPCLERSVKSEVADLPECDTGFMGLKEVPDYCYVDEKEFEIAVLPGVFAMKETGFGFALYNEATFYLNKSEQTGASRLGLSFAYTLRKQYLVRAPVLLNFKDNQYVIEGVADFRVYPNRYYGVGNDSSWDYQLYSENVLSLFFEPRARLVGPLYAGINWSFRNVFRFDTLDVYNKKDEQLPAPNGGPLTTDPPVGAEKNLNHGMGPLLVYDTRDDAYYPLRGAHYKTHLTTFGQALGGDYNYLLWVVDARQYIPVGKKQVLAVQVLSEWRQGDVPFSSMAEFGGPWQMRGYFRGRYRDKNMAIVQAEYRFPIYARLSGVAFADTGQVYGKERFQLDRMRWTAGLGARFRFGDRTYVRADFGGNNETLAGIFNGGQAF